MPAMSAPRLNTSGRVGNAKQFLTDRLPAIVGFGVPYLLVIYLALREGGYDQVARSEMGIAVWLVVLFGAIAGLLPVFRLSRTAWIGIALLTALALWTGLAALWSESAERSVIEAARVATLLGVFVLALCIRRKGALRRTIGGVGAAVATVAALALASRFLPDLLPNNDVVEALPTEQARLGYPLDYWNGLATLTAIGIPLLLYGAAYANGTRVRSLACGLLPLLALTAFFTLSRGGVVEAAVGLVALAALAPSRLRLVYPAVAASLGSAVLIVLANARAELSDGLDTDVAKDQGLEMLALTILVCAVVGLGNLLVQRRLRQGRWRLPELSARRSRPLALGIVAVVVVGAVLAGVPGKLGDNWEEFKEPATPSGDTSRFQSVSGSGRYQWWGSAVDAGWSAPVVGIGPGTFEYWWARDDVEITGFVRDAHSLYLEAFGELGAIGFMLVVAGVGGALWIGIRRLRRVPEDRAPAAAATAAMVVFAAAAAIDWSWELTVLPVTFLLLTAALIDGRSADGARDPGPAEIALPVLAILSLAVITPPLLSEVYVSDSQEASREDRLADALQSARRAESMLPMAATPHLQQALVLQRGGLLGAAADQARTATEKEATNWRTWLVLSRIEEDRGRTAAASRALERSEELNPRSLLFQIP